MNWSRSEGEGEKIPLQWKVLKNGQVGILFWLE